MIRCKEVTQLLASDQLAEQRWVKRVEVKFHLWMCRNCARFAKQLAQIRETARRLFRQLPKATAPEADQDLETRLVSKLIERADSRG